MTAQQDPAQATNLHIHRKGNSIMKCRNTLFFGTSIAAAIAAIGMAAPALGQITGNLLGTPDDGMVCRAGYSGAFSGSFKCSKTHFLVVNLVCTNPSFPKYTLRVGEDICTRSQFNAPSSGPIGGVANEDYVKAAVNTAALSAEVVNLGREEARALGLDAKDVDTKATAPATQTDKDGSRDKAVLQVTHYTFAIPTGGAISASR